MEMQKNYGVDAGYPTKRRNVGEVRGELASGWSAVLRMEAKHSGRVTSRHSQGGAMPQ